MRILMFSKSFGGPTTTFIQNDLLELAKNHTVKYLATEFDTTGSFRYPDYAIVEFNQSRVSRKLHWILETNGWYLNNGNRAFAKQVNAIIDQFKPDLIQCNFGIEALMLTDNLSSGNKQIPLIINFLGYDASYHLGRGSYVRKLIELTHRPNVYATCNTQFLKNNLEAKHIYFKHNRIIHTGVRTDFFDRHNVYPEHRKFIFLQIASFSYRKGQEVAIRAFKRMLDTVSDPDRYKLIFAGGDDDPTCMEMRKLPSELGIQERIEFRPWVTPAESRSLMIDANCFVQHSRTIEGRTEGIPTAVSEAMSMELPVISTLHAGIPELVEDGVNGFLVAENDIEHFAKRMKDIQTFGYLKKNRDKVEKEFNLANRTVEFEKYYSEILSLRE
jgi:colanic acid/amylovoran biosynthesis glycosyltransferase